MAGYNVDLLASSTARGQNISTSPQQLINFYAQPIADGKSPFILQPIPGTKTLVNFTGKEGILNTDKIRRIYKASNGRVFVFISNKLFEYIDNSNVVYRGTISDFNGILSVTDNGKYLVWSNGSVLQYCNMVSFNKFIATLPFNNPEQVVWYNERLFVSNRDTVDNLNKRNIYWSTLGDEAPTAWSALDFLGSPTADSIIGLKTAGSYLYAFGTNSYYIYGKSINPELPISQVAGGGGNISLGSQSSLAQIGESIFFLGGSAVGSRQVIQISGPGSVNKISTAEVEYKLLKGDLNDAYGFAYSQLGHIFYGITFSNLNKTFVYDTVTQTWHERSTRSSNTGEFELWRYRDAESAFDDIIMAATDKPFLVKLDPDKYDEYDGKEITRVYTSKVIFNELKDIFHRSLVIDVETGHGLQKGQGEAPLIAFSFSDDGGYTWSSEQFTSLGKIGEYKRRVQFRRLGRSRERVYKFLISDPVKVSLIGAVLDAQAGLR